MSFIAAVVQMQGALYDREANLARTTDFIGEAIAGNAKLIVLPEMIIPGYGLATDRLKVIAEPVNGPTFRAWSELAARHSVWIVGGFCEIHDDRLYNAAMLVGPGGLVGHYRKLHLFSEEKQVFADGDLGLKVYSTPLGRIGLCVCYDLRFMEVARILSLMGADIIAVPTAWVGGFDHRTRDEAGFIGQARGAVVQANLNQTFLLCASQSGRTDTLKLLGSSLIVDPFGTVAAGPLDDDAETVVFARIDPAIATAAQIRSDLIRPRQDRRTDVYGLMAEGKFL